jgi:hypothetical protein
MSDSTSESSSFANRYAKKSNLDRGKLSEQSGSFTEKFKQKGYMSASGASPDSDLLFLVKGIDDSRPAWYYILVERLKLSMFKKALNDNIIHLEKYGKILYSAYGEEPPEEIKKRVLSEFGIKDDDAT